MSVSDVAASVAAANASTAASTASKPKGVEAMGTGDFLKLLITQLTSQDPFDPVKNQDMLNQIGSIRSLEMNDQLTKTLKSMTDQTGVLNSTMNTMMLQSNLNSAGGMIGKMVSGISGTGDKAVAVAGQVLSVRVSDNKVMLQLSNGQSVSMDAVNHVVNPNDIAGKIVVGKATDGANTSGEVTGLLVRDGKLVYQLSTNHEVSVDSVAGTFSREDLMGKMASVLQADGSLAGGLVTGVKAENGSMMLELDTGGKIPLSSETVISEGSLADATAG